MAMTNAEKQAAYRERLRADGKTQRLVTVDASACRRDMRPATRASKLPPPAGIDRLSWFSGYIEGKGHRRA